jgi:NADPH-dependent F420 reductase
MSTHDLSNRVIAVIGGTGAQGRGLARRFAAAGLAVKIGSRDAGRATDAASAGADVAGDVEGMTNIEAASAADIVIFAVPWAGHADVLEELRPHLRDKIVVDCVNPIGFDAQGPYVRQIPEGSAVQQAAALLPEARVVGAFHHVSATLLEDATVTSIDVDILVVGDDREATEVVQALAALIPGVRGIYGGRLRNAHQVEAITANLITINRTYQSHSGLRITDI